MELKELQREYEMVAAGKQYIKMAREEEAKAAIENVSSETSSEQENYSEEETEPTEKKEKLHVGYFAKKIKRNIKKRREEKKNRAKSVNIEDL